MLTALVFSGLESKLHDGFNLISSYLAFLYRNVTSHNIVIYTMLSSPSAACASLPQVYVVDISCGVSGQCDRYRAHPNTQCTQRRRQET